MTAGGPAWPDWLAAACRGGAEGLVRKAGRPASEADGLPDEEFGAAARHEDTGIDGYSQAAELRPPHHVLERLARRPPVYHRGEVCGRAGRGDQQPRFVLGEDTAGGAKPGHDGGRRR